MYMKKIIILLAFVLGIIILINFFLKNTLQGRLWSFGININLSGFQLTNFAKDETRSLKSQTLEARKGDVFIEITKTEAENHQKLIDDRIYLLNSLFVPTTSPYPEVITNIISCPDEFKPKAEKVTHGTIFTLFAGERYNFGICTSDLIKYQAVYGIFDCDKKGVFEIILFGQNAENLNSTVKSFYCK